MRKFMSILLILVLLSIANPILANMEDKLSNHWAKK